VRTEYVAHRLIDKVSFIAEVLVQGLFAHRELTAHIVHRHRTQSVALEHVHRSLQDAGFNFVGA
jgi:creatinine amidohydrolase/Fe(II)-dependent formamide hydrolase-like protein